MHDGRGNIIQSSGKLKPPLRVTMADGSDPFEIRDMTAEWRF
jgi:hypothetical protein